MSDVADSARAKPSPGEIFDALPPLGSAEYLRRLRTAPAAELPPEVLARAYRVLAAEGDEEACRATLARLLGEKNGRPEYLSPLLLLAARTVPPYQHWQEALDLYQDAVALIIEVLPASQGRFAERAWTSFCRQRLVDAWRSRQGRRGERREPARVEPPRTEAGDEPDLFDRCFEPPPWHASVEPDKRAWLEDFVARTLSRISDPFIRAVAEDQWLADEPSPISGAANGKQPLAARWGKSRFQVHRALDWARAFLYAALETQDEVEIDLGAFRRRRAASRETRRRP
jgi:hypothetical protein